MLIPFGFMKKEAGGGGSPLGAVANLNTWTGVVETATHAFTASAGTNRYLIGIVGMETSSSTQAPPTGATYGGKTMTLIKEVNAIGGWNTTQMWGLKDADFPASGSQNFVVTGYGGTEAPSLIMGCFEGVNQTTPINLTNGIGSDDASTNPSTGAILTINTDDMAVMSYASTGGLNTSAWYELVVTPHTILVLGGTNDPCEAIFKAYTGSNITDGQIRVTGGTNDRCPMIGAILTHD